MKQYIILSIVICCLYSHVSYTKSNFEHFFNKGCTAFHHSNHAKAIHYFKKTIDLSPHCFQAYYNLGLIHELKEEYTQAIDYFLKALTVNPTYTKPHINLATIYYKQEQFALAKKHYQQALITDPQNSTAHHHLGKIFLEETILDQCIYHFEMACSLESQNVHMLLDLANAKNMANQTEDALRLYFRIDALLPNNPSILYNIAYTFKKLGRLQEAMPFYQRVLTINPDHAEAHFSYGLALLLTGNWNDGWKEYEWRWTRNERSTFPHFNKPMWDGSDLHGKTIYLRAEQGLGDTFQFVRYAKVAKDKGGKVIVAVQQPLLPYMKLLPYADLVISVHDTPPSFDVYAALVSCPMILGTDIDTVPVDIPYLPADESLVHEWRNKLSHDKQFKIGICWQGNPNYSTHFLRMAVAAKSMPLDYFIPLFSIPGTSFYCLQLKTGTDQLHQLKDKSQLTIFDEQFDVLHGNFMDSAAVIKNLDLVITIDTSTGHFAAGLGVKTWVLLPEPPDWRWMLDRTDTPWYPNMKLFRQPKPGDWQSVMDTVATELITLLDMHS